MILMMFTLSFAVLLAGPAPAARVSLRLFDIAISPKLNL